MINPFCYLKLKPVFLLKLTFFFILCNTIASFSQETKKINTARDFFIKGNTALKQNKIDSSYYYYNKAIKFYEVTNDSLQIAKLLYNKSKLAYHQKEYYKSSESLITALHVFKNFKDSIRIFNSYNFLGLLYKNQGLLSNSIKYHNKALYLAKKIKNKKLQLISLNNIGVTYKEKKEYKRAISFFNEAFTIDSLFEKYPSKYARLLDNKATCNLQLENTKEVLEDFFNALKIRTKLGDTSGEIQSNINLAAYFKFQKNLIEARKYSKRALVLATEIKEIESVLDALKSLSEIDIDNASKYLKLYIRINDSITKEQVKYRNQFSIIEFETQEKEKQNLFLQNQNTNKELLLQKENFRKWIFGIGLLLTLIVSFFIWKKYKTEKQSKTTILEQKNKIEEQKKMVEKIHKELHHRLKNNLSIIDLFITLAKDKFTDKLYQDKLSELQNRINSMFAIHKQLIKEEKITALYAKPYIEALTKKIQETYLNANIEIAHHIDAKQLLHTKASFPFGIIINEFVTNSYKYAFKNNEKGIITIKLYSDEINYYLELSDNGIGLPKNFDIENLNSFGIDIIKLLTQENEGTFSLNGINGVIINIILLKETTNKKYLN